MSYFGLATINSVTKSWYDKEIRGFRGPERNKIIEIMDEAVSHGFAINYTPPSELTETEYWTIFDKVGGKAQLFRTKTGDTNFVLLKNKE